MAALLIFVFMIVLVSLPIHINSINITPGGNLTFQSVFYPGKCIPDVTPYLFPTNKSLLEGRWYAKHLSFQKEQVSEFDCYCWDLFFENNDTFYDFISVYENGEHKTKITKLIQIPDKPIGTYDVYTPGSTSKTTSSLFYTDGEMLIFWDTTCVNDANHTRNVAVSYRNLNFAKDLKPHTDRMLKRVSDVIGEKLHPHETKQSNCKYPPKMENPFN